MARELTSKDKKKAVGGFPQDVESLPSNNDIEAGATGKLHTDLKSRHMQMIAIGGAIGAGIFVGSGSALSAGGPGALVVCYLIIGVMLLFTCQALAELAVLYPVNGAFFSYIYRFIDPSWSFAVGWGYALSWLILLPFELTAACLTLQFWQGARDINVGVWITIFLVVLAGIQIFGVRGYGEVEFVLSIIKIMACVGFIILGIVIDCGGVGDRGYLGASYWRDPGAFRNGFNGFCSVFVVASFAFGGTELVGLAAAESANPRQQIPKATKQVFFRICFFYVVNLFVLGLIVRSDDKRLQNATGANTEYSPFVIAMEDAGIKVLPSIFNAVILLAVISVANASSFGSTRTIQAMAQSGMAPRFFAYVDKAGRPIYCVALQIAFGFLAFIDESGKSGSIFNWLLALTGLMYFFTWGSINLAHIRFRAAWKAQGNRLDSIPYKPTFGVIGSYIGLGLNVICLIAVFYSALYPTPGATPTASAFFQQYLAAPIILMLYLGWKLHSRDWRMYVPLLEVDLVTGARELQPGEEVMMPVKTWRNLPARIFHALF